jgi:ribonuclease HI
VRGHVGDTFNEMADELAGQAARAAAASTDAADEPTVVEHLADEPAMLF